jgi:uncharacterized protein YndB with AHSA1/START domain
MTTLTGHFTVALPPDEAFTLFTARGEQAWVEGWQPRFPAPTPDDTTPGTVFQTGAHDETTTWIVIDSEPGHTIRYARVTPTSRAGTVTVTLTPEAPQQTTVEVTYQLTPLTDAAKPGLDHFAETYPAYLASWEKAITTHLSR